MQKRVKWLHTYTLGTLGKKYDNFLLKTARDKIMAEQLSRAKSRLAVDKDFE